MDICGVSDTTRDCLWSVRDGREAELIWRSAMAEELEEDRMDARDPLAPL